MPTVAELASRAHRDVGFILFIQGCDWALTNRPELAGSGVDSWVGTSNGARRIVEGLEIGKDLSVTNSVSTETGMPDSSDGATFKLIDFSGDLPDYLRVPEGDLVGQVLRPRDDPAPAVLNGDTGVDVPLWGRFINGEAIGEAGERNRFQCFPGDPMPGFNHVAFSADMASLGPSIVTDRPSYQIGRRMVVLLRLHRDVTASTTDYTSWPSWEKQLAGGHAIAFVGTVKDLTARGQEFTLSCDGPSSLLRRMCNVARPDGWAKIGTTTNLSSEPGAREDLMAVAYRYECADNLLWRDCASSYFDPANDALPTTGNPTAYRNAVNARLGVVAGLPGPSGWTFDSYSDPDEGDFVSKVEMGIGYTSVEVDHVQVDPIEANWRYWAGIAVIIMHSKLWSALGYDVHGGQKPKDYSTPFEIDFISSAALALQGIATPGPGYYAAEVTSVGLGYQTPDGAGVWSENKGAPRVWRARNEEGISELYPQGKQELSAGLGKATPYCEPQTNLAPANYTLALDGGDCDATGYIALRATLQTSSDAEPVQQVAIAKVSWREDDEYGGSTIGQNSKFQSQLYLERYMDARFFGIDRLAYPTKVWSSTDLEWVSVAWLGWNTDFGDRADLVLLRTLLGTGTSYLTGYYGENPVRTLGLNAHPDAIYDEGNDVEIADLTLGVNSSLVSWKSFTKTAALLPDGGASSPLNRCKHAFIGAFDSQELVARILAPRGWALGFNCGRFTLFSLPRTLTPDLATVLIEPDDFVSESDAVVVEDVSFSELAAKDKFSCTYGTALVPEAAAENEMRVEIRAQDAASRLRHGNAQMDIDGSGLIPLDLWKGKYVAANWRPAWQELFGTTMAEWYAAAHTMVRGITLQWSKAKLIGPGTIVRFSSHFAPNRAGGYGYSAMLGLVLSVKHNIYSGTASADILIAPGTGVAFTRRFGPCAHALDLVEKVEGRHSAATRTIYCHANYFGHEGDDPCDVRGFIEPAFLGLGGEAVCNVYQWTGLDEDEDWPLTCSFTLESVSQSENSLTYKPGSLVGRFNEAAPACIVFAPWDDQPSDSWVRSYFSVHTNPAGSFGLVPTKGYPLL